MPTAEGEGRSQSVQTWRGPLPHQSDQWPGRAGKEFYSKIKGVAFSLSRYQDLICILNAHSGICIKRAWGSWGVGDREGALEPHILNFSEAPPKATYPVQHIYQEFWEIW